MLRLTAERLDAALTGQTLVRAELRWPSAAGADLTGVEVLGTHAVGKHLLTRFADGRTLHTHLRMDGSWRVARTGTREAEGRSPTVRAVLATSRWTCLGWHLGMLDVVRTRDERTVVGHLGPDLLADDFPAAGLARGVERLGAQAGRPLAEALLDQRTVAGLGTIWTAESLWSRRLWPWTPAGSLPPEERRALLLEGRRLMGRSVLVGRTQGLGRVDVHVHGRAGRPCRRCGAPVQEGTAFAPPYERPVFWCPVCQAAPGPAGAPVGPAGPT